MISICPSEEPSANANNIELPFDSSSSKKYLLEISNLIKTAKGSDLINNFSSRSNLVRLLDACVNESGLGRKILAEIARSSPMLLKQFVHHQLILDSSPAIRMMCVECLYDLINACAEGKPIPVKKTQFREPSQSPSRTLDEYLIQKPSPGIRLSSESDDVKIGGLLEMDSDAKSKCSFQREAMASQLIGLGNITSIEEEDDMYDSQVLGHRESFSQLRLIDSISEEIVPSLNKTKGSAAWFLRDAVKGSGELDLEDSSESGSEEEIQETLSPSDQEKQEEEWLQSFRGTSHSIFIEPRPSILKSSSLLLKPSDSEVSIKVPDTAQNAFMYKLLNFGVLTALSDLASLDPVSKSCDLVQRTLALLLMRAPSALLPNLPEKFGRFSRTYRELRQRPACRPRYLNSRDRKNLTGLYGGLTGWTLVLGEGRGYFSERLMSYFYGHCGHTAKDLIITMWNEPLEHIALHPGFGNTFHKLSQCSNVKFEEEQEVKEFDPEDMPKSLSCVFRSTRFDIVRPKILFGIDPSKLGSNQHFKDYQFNTVIWNMMQADGRKYFNKNLLSSFIYSVVDILHPKGCIHITFYQKEDTDLYKEWELDEVIKKASLFLATTRKFPMYLCGDREKLHRAAKLYIFKLIGTGEVELSDADTYSDDTYSEQSS